MSHSLIKIMFSVLGTLLVSIILFTMIFTATGQNFMWKVIEPVMLDQWRQCSMDNGAKRTVIYEQEFNNLKAIEYSRQTNVGGTP